MWAKKIPTKRRVHTLTGTLSLEIWKIRIPAFSKPQLLEKGLPKKYTDADSLFMIYYKKSKSITEEEKAYIREEKEREAYKKVKEEKEQAIRYATELLVRAARQGNISTANENSLYSIRSTTQS